MPPSTERRFTLRAAIQETLSTGLGRMRREAQQTVAPLRQLLTGLNTTDRALRATARAANAMGNALDRAKGLPSTFNQTDDELRKAAAAARELDEALTAATRTRKFSALAPGQQRQVRQSIRQAQLAQTQLAAVSAIPEGQRLGTDELQDATESVLKLAGSAPKLKQVAQALLNQGRQATVAAKAWRQLSAGARIAVTALRSVITTSRAAIATMRSLVAIVGRAVRALFSFRSLIVVAIGVAALRGVVQYADGWLELQNRLKLVTASQQETNRAVQDVYQIAQNARQPLNVVADTYFRIARGSKVLARDQERLAGVTELVAKAVAISATTAESASAALFQFGQGLSADALRGQELNAVMEQTPRLAIAIADGMGVTVGQLRKLASEGKLTANTVIEAIESQADVLNAEFANTTSTIGQAITRLDNALGRLVGIFTLKSGLSSGLVGAINAVTDAMDNLVDRFEDRVGGIRVLVRDALNPNVPPEQRQAAQQDLGKLLDAAGDVVEAVFKNAARVVVSTVSSGIIALVRTLFPVISDFFRDQISELVSLIPGGEGLVAPSLPKQLRNSRASAKDLVQQLNAVNAELNKIEERSNTPQGTARTGGRSQQGTRDRNRIAELEAQRVQINAKLNQTRNQISLTLAEIPAEASKRQVELDKALVGIVESTAIALGDGQDEVRIALDKLQETIEEVVPTTDDATQQVVAGASRLQGAVADLFSDMVTSGRSALDELTTFAGEALEQITAVVENDLIPRRLEAYGKQVEAARVRLIQRQGRELAETPASARSLVQEVQQVELQRFDLDAQRSAAVERLNTAQEKLTDTERRLETQVKLGNLTRREARELSDQQRAAFAQQAEAALAEMDVLEQRFPQFQEVIQKTREQLQKVIEGASDDEAPTRGFYPGFMNALADIREEAANTYRLGQQFADTLTSNLTNGLLSAIEAGVRGTKSWGEAFQDWAVDTLIAIGKVLAQAALLYAVAIGLEAIAPGLASVLSLSVQAGAASGRNQGGVVGRNEGGAMGNGGVSRGGGGAGFVFGPRGPNRDSILTALTTGEVVWSRPAVDRAGGAQRVMAMHDLALRGGLSRTVLGFNSGGLVGSAATPAVSMPSGQAAATSGAGPDAAVLDLTDGRNRESLALRLMPVIIKTIADSPADRRKLQAILRD